MTRVSTCVALVLIGFAASEVRAQNVPEPPTVRLEDFLIRMGQQFGIALYLEEPLDDRIVINSDELPVEAVVKGALTRYSYLLIYSGPWRGPLTESPNRLHVFAHEAAQYSWQSITDRGSPDAIEQIDDIIESAGGDDAALAARLAAVLESTNEIALREEAVYALAKIDAAFSRNALTLALSDDSTDVREAAVIAITDNAYPDARRLLHSALGDRSSAVRETAIDGLMQLDQGSVKPK